MASPVEHTGRTCPLCGGSSAVADQLRAGRVRRCEQCGLGWLEASTTAPAFADEVYDQTFFDVFRDPEYNEKREQVFALHLDQISAMRPPGRRLLDVGAALGDFVEFAQGKEWIVTGIEPAHAAYEDAARRGLPIRHGTIEDVSETFDVLHLSHVLEHLPDPFRALARCFDLLRPGGVLAIEVPNEFDNLFKWVRHRIGRTGPMDRLTEEHSWFFNPSTLRRAVTEAGFQVEVLRTRNWGTLKSKLPLGGAIKRVVDVTSTRLGRGEVIEVYARRP